MKRLPDWPWAAHVGIWIAALVLGFVSALYITGTRPAVPGAADPPVSVTCRGLLAQPGAYDRRVIRLSTVGMRPGPGPGEISYSRFWAVPPSVVCRFPGNAPIPVPGWIVGQCDTSSTADVIVVLNCRAD